MDISTELASISSDLHALANAISERHINRTTATHRARLLALAVTNVKLYVDRQSGEFGQAYAEGLDSTTFDADCTAPDDNCICMKCNTGHKYYIDGASFRMSSSEPDVLFSESSALDTISNRLSRAFRQSNDYIRHWYNGRWHERGCVCTDCIAPSNSVGSDVCAYCGQEQCLCKITRY
jgi:hypothetical protein